MTPSEDLDARERIESAAERLLREAGRDAVTTRAVCAAAGVQSPTIYRHFGDMRGLLDAAASRGFADYLEAKRKRRRAPDPVDDLRRGWDLSVEFGLSHPAVYALLYGDPRPEAPPAAVTEAHAVLRGIVARIAEAGRLRVGVDRAAQMMHSACRGVTLNLISTPPAQRDDELSASTREALISAITTETDDGTTHHGTDGSSVARHAIALRALVPSTHALTPSEAALLSDWLDRIAAEHAD